MADKKATLLLQLKDKASKQMGKVGNALQNLKKNWLGITAAVAAFIAVGADMVRAFIKQENAVEKLNISLKNQGIVSEAVSKDIQNYAAELQKITTVGDEVILEQQALLVSFGLTGKELETTTKAALDLSAGLGIDLKAATLLLGKAFTGETSALSRYGIKIEEGLDESEKFTAVMTQLNKQFGGAAEARLNTFSGRMENLGNRVGDLKEIVGEQLIPVLETWARWADKLVTLLEKMSTALNEQEQAANLQLQMANRQREASIKAVVRKLEEKAATEGLTEAEQARLDNANRMLGVIEARAEAEEAANQNRLQSFVATEEAIDEKEIEKQEKEAEKREQELAQLDQQTAIIIDKFNERANLTAGLSQKFQGEEFRKLDKFLTDSEKRELLSQTRKLKEAGKFNDARLIQDVALAEAQKREEAALEETRVAQAENRKAVTQSTLNFISSLSQSKNKELVAIGKAAAITSATIDTFAAANKTLASLPWPANLIAAAGVVAAGLVNVAKISGVQLEHGGIIQPTRGGTIAQIAEAGKSEAVIPLDDDRAREELGGIIGGTNITINAGVIVGGEDSMRELAIMIDEEFFKLDRNRQAVSLG